MRKSVARMNSLARLHVHNHNGETAVQPKEPTIAMFAVAVKNNLRDIGFRLSTSRIS
jgi:hypothetical protein